MTSPSTPDDPALNEKSLQLRQLVTQAARHAYEDARVRGLCEEGAIEATFAALEQLDPQSLQPVFSPSSPSQDGPSSLATLTTGWKIVHDLGSRLIAGLEDVDVTSQSAGVANHPAWTVSHLAHYHPAILSLLRGEPVADPALAADAGRHDEGSAPVASPDAYLPWRELVEKYTQGQAAITQALGHVTGEILASPPGLVRWARSFPTTADLLAYLMLIHESQHQGQLMAWRRAMGRALA